MKLFLIAILMPFAILTSKSVPAGQPIFISVNCGSGSAFSYGLEITEDKNGDGLYDTRSIRDCNGTWTSDCWPTSCNKRSLAGPVSPTQHHSYSTSYDSTAGFYVWAITEVADTNSLAVHGILQRQPNGDLTYTPVLPLNNNSGNSGENSLFSVLPWGELKVTTGLEYLNVLCTTQKGWLVTVDIIALTEQVLATLELPVNQGSNEFTIPANMMTRGVYMLRIVDGSEIHSKLGMH